MYKLVNDAVVRLHDNAHIPVDKLNTDYKQYLDWVRQGNQAQVETSPSTAPESVTMRQARLALLQAGLLSAVQTSIAAITDPVEKQAAQIEWEFAATVDRGSAFTQKMATALNLTQFDLDNLFTNASGL